MVSPASPRRTVLFVDDQRLIRTAYVRQLRRRVDVVTEGPFLERGINPRYKKFSP